MGGTGRVGSRSIGVTGRVGSQPIGGAGGVGSGTVRSTVRVLSRWSMRLDN